MKRQASDLSQRRRAEHDSPNGGCFLGTGQPASGLPRGGTPQSAAWRRQLCFVNPRGEFSPSAPPPCAELQTNCQNSACVFFEMTAAYFQILIIIHGSKPMRFPLFGRASFGPRAGVWSQPVPRTCLTDGLTKPASCRADGRIHFVGVKSSRGAVTLDRTGKKLAWQSHHDLKHQGWFQDVVQTFVYNSLRFTDSSPLFFPVPKIILPAFEKCRERWKVQPSQMIHGFGPEMGLLV